MFRQYLLLLVAMPQLVFAAPLFESANVLEVRLSGPLSSVMKNAASDEEFAFVAYAASDEVPVKVRARGNSRLRECDFPPLRLNFAKDTTSGSVFADQDKVKLVTHCNDKRKDSGVVLDEYLAYRIFNMLSEYSYRVRLLRIAYEDTDGSRDAEQRYGFVLESDDAFAARTGTEIQKLPGVVYSHLDDDQATLIYVFQYLIGNTDWSLVTATTDEHCCHNGDLFKLNDRLLLVPYDFDLAGLVDASYARPDATLRIRSVRSRIYRGYCTSPDRVHDALHKILAAQSSILELASVTPAESARDRELRVSYLEKFFASAADEEKLLQNFARKCLD
jgi:hypothetical protein